MGSEDLRLERQADRALARAQHHEQRSLSTMNANSLKSFGTLSGADEFDVPVYEDKDFEELGGIGPSLFVKRRSDGAEFKLTGELADFEFSNRPYPGQIHVVHLETRTNSIGLKERVRITRRGTLLPAGTYDRIKRSQAVARGRKAQPVRPIDALDFPALRRRQAEHTVVGEPLALVQGRDQAGNVEVIIPEPLRRSTALHTRPASEPVRGAPALIAWLTKKHVTLSLVDGRLAASVPGGRTERP